MREIGVALSVSEALICLLLLILPLARGGVDWRVQLVASIVAAVALLLAPRRAQTQVTPLLVGLCVIVGLILLQLLPLPAALVEGVSPNTANLWRKSSEPLGLFPRAVPLSLDPAATALEAGKAFACLAVAWVAFLLLRSEESRLRLSSSLSVSGALVVASGLVYAIASGGSGLEPGFPFVNPNHSAGFLNLSAWPALGLAMQNHRRRRLFFLGCFVLAGSGVFLSLSRGGIASFGIGGLIFAVLFVRRDQRTGRFRNLAMMALAAVAVVGVAAFLGRERIVAELASLQLTRLSSEEKVAIWPVLYSIVRRFPWFGIGRGAFFTTFPVFKVDADHWTWTHAENEWLQSLLDLGIPGGLLLIGSFAWTWIRAALPRHCSPLRVGLLAGTFALAVHNVVDFSLEVLGIAMPFAVASAILARSDVRWGVPRLAPQIIGGCALVVSSLGSFAYGAYSAQEEGERLAAKQDLQRILSGAREMVERHPVDYFPHAIAGMRLAALHRCDQALPWLFRAMWLKPTEAGPHYFTGNCLASLRRDSLAKREYRLAFLLGRQEALSAAIQHYPALTDLLDVAPESAEGLTALGALLADRSRPREASDVLEKAWRDYGDLASLARLGDVALQLGEIERAIEWSRLLQARDARWVSSYTVASAAFLRQGDLDSALAELNRGTSQVPGHPDLIFPQVQLLIRNRLFAQARQVIRQLVPRSPQETARMHQLSADALRAEGRIVDAIAELQAAQEAEPNGLHLYEELADALAEVGRVSEALETLRRAALLPNSPAGAFDARISKLLLQHRKQLERAPVPSYAEE